MVTGAAVAAVVGVSVTLSTGTALEVTRTSGTVGATGIGVAVSTLLEIRLTGVTSRVRPVRTGKMGTVLAVLWKLQQ